MVKTYFHPYRVGDEKYVHYDVIPDSTGVTLYFNSIKRGVTIEKTLRFDFAEHKDSVVQVTLLDNYKMDDVVLFKVYEITDRDSFKRNFAYSPNDTIIARLVFNEDCSDVVVFLLQNTVKPEGSDWNMVERFGNCTTGYLASFSPYFANLVEKKKIKAKMMNNIDPNASIAYLESQVDALTRIVLSLNPPASPMKDILLEADSHSVLDVKDSSKIISEFNSDKAKIRGLQANYYVEKNTIN